MPVSDTDIERMMGRLLQGGVLLAGLVMVVGGALFLSRHGAETPQYSPFHGVPPEFRSPAAIVRGVGSGRARSIIQLGALLMIATPVMRVAFAIYAFARERDWLYMAISAVVLALLAYALFW